MSAINLVGVGKSYGSVTALHPLDLEIKAGEFVVLVGPSGCGKSTLLRCIAGLEAVSSGRIEMDGQDVTNASPVQRGIAMVFQSYAIYPHMSVAENIGFGLKIAKMRKAERTARVNDIAKMLQLEPYLARKPAALSGGQRQRVAIGRALARQPAIFLFDEPLSNLDAALRGEMREEIANLHKTLRRTMVYVTHDQLEAMSLADRIVVLRAGRIEQQGSPLDLYNHPCNRFVAGFLGQNKMNFFQLGDSSGSSLGIRPEDFLLDDSGAYEITVTRRELLGGETLIYGKLGDGHEVLVNLSGQVLVEIGTQLRLSARRVYRFDGEVCVAD
ncbi:MAG: ABC transporter ATP-binding protein [Candidatus Symbiobacter sp.]|nr:ABC transporter ATP-binding protein [Candidatus Symbiobacter sp.]